MANLTRGSMVLGHFRILQRLWPPEERTLDKEVGRGQFGIAYLATNTETNDKVVLKVFIDFGKKIINTGSALNRDQTKRIAAASKECTASSNLINAKEEPVGKGRFVKCLKDGTKLGAEAYVEIEYFEGQTLQEWAAAFDMDYPAADALTNIVKMMMQGLAHIEDKFVHCDIKEDNVMVSSDASDLKFIDFGFVTEANKQTDDIAGTPSYKPPEALSDLNDYIPRSSWDIWSVGIVVYQMLCQRNLLSELMPQIRKQHKQEDDQMKAFAAMLENPDTFTENCMPYEDFEEDEPALFSLLKLILEKVLVKESDRKKASELLSEPIFQ